MARNKLTRFQENKSLNCIIQPKRIELMNGYHLKGKWNHFFGNSNSIVLELGCGKGEYSIKLARKFPNKNFIGIDIKGARIWCGAKKVEDLQIKNIAFLRTQIEFVDFVFDKSEISEIWITFPDPQIKFRRTKHRLTHPFFLKKYKKIIQNKGIIHLKTDSEFLYGYTHGILQELGHKVIQSRYDIYDKNEFSLELDVKQIQTHYEKLFLSKGKTISYMKFYLK